MAELKILPQGTQMEHTFHRAIEKLKEVPSSRKLLEETAAKGAAASLNSVPRWTSPMSAAVFGAVLRLKTNSVHRDLETQLTCDWCKTKLEQHALSHHLSGCTKIHGMNAASVHSSAKEMLKLLFRYCHICFDEAEPTDYERRHCPACKTNIHASSQELLDDHVRSCPGNVTAEALQTVSRQRPDIRFYYYDEHCIKRTAVLDVSMTSTLLSDSSALETRVRKKKAMYEELARANGEEFYAIIITDTGKVSVDCAALARILSQHRELMPATNALSAIATIGCRARAASLINGERKHGVQHIALGSEYEVMDEEECERLIAPVAPPPPPGSQAPWAPEIDLSSSSEPEPTRPPGQQANYPRSPSASWSGETDPPTDSGEQTFIELTSPPAASSSFHAAANHQKAKPQAPRPPPAPREKERFTAPLPRPPSRKC